MTETAASFAVKAEVQADASVRTHPSVWHAISAALLASDAARLESEPQDFESTQHDKLRAVSVAAITTSAFFLESSINEFFVDFLERKAPDGWDAVLPKDQRDLAAVLWESAGIDRLQPIEKYEVALTVFGRPGFDRGARPYQDAALVVRVRNALAHAKPMTDGGKDTSKVVRDLSNDLRGRFERKRLTGSGDALFPHPTLGAGGARWAFVSALAFIDAFFARLGVVPRYEAARAQLVVR